MTHDDHAQFAKLAASSGAKYKILVYDGQYVDKIEAAGIRTCSKPKLLDANTKIDQLFPSMFPHWEAYIKQHLKKCELVDVELRILKTI
jgi:hypothetical protein